MADVVEDANSIVDEANKFMKESPASSDLSQVSGVYVPNMSEQYMNEYSAFSEFIGRHGRSYASKDEHMGRFDVFVVNYRDVNAHNARFAAGEVTWEKAVNQFTDMTEQEFHERYLSNTFIDKPVLDDLDYAEDEEEEDSSRPHMV